jgi:hypothetical protein
MKFWAKLCIWSNRLPFDTVGQRRNWDRRIVIIFAEGAKEEGGFLLSRSRAMGIKFRWLFRDLGLLQMSGNTPVSIAISAHNSRGTMEIY